ncbi:hypothetical protein [Halorarius litoreus]|uniref:hypothetical protein n=1 Tax=Halorarius litoreus TaxID=2962676 RepID=UPI0020CBEA8E|nr:hypothetical protein [Halorarius litoreus]
MSRLSHRGAVVAFSGVVCLVVAGMGSLGGESLLAVGLAAVAGALGLLLAVRDALGTPPSTTALISVASVCGLGAVASLPGQRWFTAAALVGVGVMNFARANDKWVPESAESDE